MSDVGGLDHSGLLQLPVLSANMVEQPPASSEQYGHEVNLYFVKKPSSQVLLKNNRAAGDRDILVPRCGSCLLQRAFDSVGDEGIRCA